MILILIHPDYQKGSSLCPVCNKEKGVVRRNSLRLCLHCDTAALRPNTAPATRRTARPGFPARGAVLLTYWITIMLLEAGWAVSNVFRVLRGSVNEQGSHAPDRHPEQGAGRSTGEAVLRECNI